MKANKKTNAEQTTQVYTIAKVQLTPALVQGVSSLIQSLMISVQCVQMRTKNGRYSLETDRKGQYFIAGHRLGDDQSG